MDEQSKSRYSRINKEVLNANPYAEEISALQISWGICLFPIYGAQHPSE
jgi:hypothetical protein